MFAEIFSVQSPSGATLACRHERARGAPLGILLVSHGLAEHSGRYGAFAERLSQSGFHVYAHDHRGHGETTAPDAPPGQFAAYAGAARVVEDMLTLREVAASRHEGLPVIVFGHSMGGLFALAFAEAHPDRLDGLAVWNSNLHPGLAGRAAQAILAVERMLKGSDVPSGLLPKLTFAAWAKSVKNRRTDFDWLSHDADAVERYIADPLCGFDASVSLWMDVFAVTFSDTRRGNIERLPKALPVHLAGGGEDPATDFGRAVTKLGQKLKQSGLEDVTAVIYPGMRHETLNEAAPDRDEAIEAFAAWCRRVATGSR